MESVGEKLRQRRQVRGVTLEAVSRTTKLSRAVLTALEEDRFDDLAAPVYVRGFIRVYAEFLELDAAQLVLDHDATVARKKAMEAEMELADSRTALPEYLRSGQTKPLSLSPATALLLFATAAIALAFVWSVSRRAKPVPIAARPLLHAPEPATATGPAAPVPTTRLGRSLPPLPGRATDGPAFGSRDSSGAEAAGRPLPRR